MTLIPTDRKAGFRAAIRERGFTLLEMTITVALLGVVALMLVPVTELVAQRQKEQELRLALRQIRQALDAYHDAATARRIEGSADSSGYPGRLNELVDGIPDATTPDHRPIFFLRRLPRDPMHPDLETPAAETWATRSYESSPEDFAPGSDIFDIRSRSDGIGLNGIPYREW